MNFVYGLNVLDIKYFVTWNKSATPDCHLCLLKVDYYRVTQC